MILDTKDSNERLSSPNNLLNKLRSLSEGKKKNDSVELFTGRISSATNNNPSRIPSLPDSANVKETLDELEDEMRDGLLKNTAKNVLSQSLTHLERNLANVDKTTDYARIAVDMGRVVASISETARLSKAGNITNQQVIIYRPVINQESNYQTIHVSE